MAIKWDFHVLLRSQIFYDPDLRYEHAHLNPGIHLNLHIADMLSCPMDGQLDKTEKWACEGGREEWRLPELAYVGDLNI
jgi:hypothetical protein